MGFWRNFYGVEESSWWIFSIEKYFRVNNIVEDEEKMKVVAMAMRGCALKWWLWRIQPHPSMSWNTFTEIFFWHFKPKWRHFFMEVDEKIEEEEEEEADLLIEPTSTVEVNHKQNHFIEDGIEKEDVELDLKSIKKNSFLEDFVSEDESLKPKEDGLKESPKMYKTQPQQANLIMKHDGEEESQHKLQLLQTEEQEEEHASGMNNKLAIWDKLKESKSQQSTMLMHLQEKLCVPSHDSSQIHKFLPTQHLATFDFTETGLFVTSHHYTTTNSPYLSSPKSVNKTQQPYFDSSLLLNIEALFSDVEFHDNGDFTIPPKPPDSKDTTNKLWRPLEIRLCPIVLAENLCLLNFCHRFISLLKPLISFLIHSLEQLFEASATKIRNCSSRLDFQQSSLDKSLILRVFVIKQQYKQLVGFEVKKLVLIFANLLLTLCLVFDPGPHHLRHCRVGYGTTLTDDTLNITNSTYRIIEDSLLFSFVEANSNFAPNL